MKKTLSITATAVLALALAGCDSSAEDPEVAPTTSEATSSATTSEEETSEEETSKEETSTPDEEESSSHDGAPAQCVQTFSGLSEGDTITGADLYGCISVTQQTMTSARMEMNVEQPIKMRTEGVVVRNGDSFDMEMTSEGTVMRRIGDKIWIDDGNGWKELDPNDPGAASIANSMDFHELFDSESQELIGVMGALKVTEVSDAGWTLEVTEEEDKLPGFTITYTINKSYYLAGMTMESEGMEVITRVTDFNEPITIEPPM